MRSIVVTVNTLQNIIILDIQCEIDQKYQILFLFTQNSNSFKYLVIPGIAPTSQTRFLFKLLIKLLLPTLG